MRAKRKSDKPFTVNLCAVCEEYHVVAVAPGDATRTIRYCRDCIQHTLGWVQFTEEQRTKLLAVYDGIAALPGMDKLLAKYRAIPAEAKKAVSIGESVRRAMTGGQP